MEFIKPYPAENKTIVTLYSEPSDLSIYIIENLLTSSCVIRVVGDNIEDWKRKTSHVAKTDCLEFVERKKQQVHEETNYNIFINLHPIDVNLFWKDILEISTSNNTKSLVIMSHRVLFSAKCFDKIPENIGVIYVGDLIGPRVDVNKDNPVSTLINNGLREEEIKVIEDEPVYPVFLGGVAKNICKWLFSFGPYGEEVLLIGKSWSLVEVAAAVKKYLPLSSFSFVKRGVQTKRKREVRVVNINTNIEEIIGETVKWLGNHTPAKPAVKDKIKPFYLRAILLMIFVLIFPYLLGVFSVAMLYVAKVKAEKGNFDVVNKYVQVSFVAAEVSSQITSILQKISVVESVYLPLQYGLSLVKSTDKIAMEAVLISHGITSLIPKILGDEVYNVNDYTNRLSLDIDRLERELQYLESEVKIYKGFAKNQVVDSFEKINFLSIRNIVKGGRVLMGSTPNILGNNSKKTYLLLFQNNMELRPTGGFIGSFALVTFSDGRLVDMSVQDVYSADGQLRGHVEPPYPIKKYLNQAGWYLRDSNWDPDFPASAQKIEWFLDKELDIPVDGVIAIDLHLVKDLIKETGPVFLKDFQTEIMADNLYEKTQTEVQGNFFPGSSKKANFLTALSRELMGEISTRPIQNYVGVLKVVYKNLDERHIQIFLHDQDAQESLSEIGWDGSVAKPTCGVGCYPDWFGANEANMGVNKANYYIDRNYQLNVNLKKEGIVKSLSINYQNNANLVIADNGNYKVYLRLMVPTESKLLYARVKGAGEVNDIYPDETSLNGRKEYGFYFEILPQQKREFSISWKNEADKNLDLESYFLYWRKQAGIEDTPAHITIETEGSMKINSVLGGFLTVDGKFEYNAVLTRDFVSRIYLK